MLPGALESHLQGGRCLQCRGTLYGAFNRVLFGSNDRDGFNLHLLLLLHLLVDLVGNGCAVFPATRNVHQWIRADQLLIQQFVRLGVGGCKPLVFNGAIDGLLKRVLRLARKQVGARRLRDGLGDCALCGINC